MNICKKSLSFLLVIALLFTALPLSFSTSAVSFGYDDPTKEEGGNEQAYLDYNEKSGRLHNLYSKIKNLKEGESLNVAYYGGSITSGSGASKMDETSWRAIVGEEITNIVREYHPDTTVTNKVLYPTDAEQFDDTIEDGILINNINAAIGASSSFFGAYRAFDDIGLDKGIDLVFLEFSYNDYCGDTYNRKYTDENGNEVIAFAAEYESIIREIYRNAPDCEIIGIFTTGSYQKTDITETRYPQLSVERAILRNYDIPYLYIGRELVKEVLKLDPNASSVTEYNCNKNAAWMTYFCDTCHPNDTGYAFYASLVNSYLNERLDAAKTFESNGGNITTTSASLDNPFFDLSVLKSSPNQIRIADLYEGHEDYLSGFEEYDISQVSTDRAFVSHRTGSLISDFAGSSLSFRFTGDAFGMWVMTTKNGGDVTANIYKVENGVRGSLVKTVTKNFNGSYDFMPGIFDVAGQLPYATYDVDIITKASDKGSLTKLARIFWNGPDEITPLMHPDVPIVEFYNDIEILNQFVGFEENNNLTVTKDLEDGSYNFTANITNEANPLKLVRYNLSSIGASLEIYPYIHVEYYIDENSENMIDRITMRARSTNSMASSALHTVNYSTNEELVVGEWATAVIDMSDYINAAASVGATPASYWKRMEFYPLGDNLTGATTDINGANIKIRSIRFSHYSEPLVPEEKVVYVSKAGQIVLPDTSEVIAFTNFSDAFDSLGMDGGIIYFKGEFDAFSDGTKTHGDVKVIGIGDSDIERAANKILIPNTTNFLMNKYGNITLDNLTLSHENALRTTFTKSDGYAITFGENVKTVASSSGNNLSVSPYTAAGNIGKTSNYVFSAPNATYDVISTGSAIYASYWTKYTGHTNYVFNAGTFRNVYLGGYNTGTADVISYGDVNFVINGGTFNYNNIYVGGYKNHSRYGNMTLTLNGGSLKYDVIVGSQVQVNAAVSNPGYASVIVNCKEITQSATGKLSSTADNRKFGRTVNKGGIPENTILIFNNAELSSQAMVEVADPCYSDYTIMSRNGKVIPVFEESSTASTSTSAGKFLGFKLKPDVRNAVPYCNGEEIKPDANGLYQLPLGASTVEFKKFNNDSVVYVDAVNGSDSNDGTTIETAFATIDHAQNWLNASLSKGEKIIYIKGAVPFDGGEPHTEMMTLKAYDADSELTFVSKTITIGTGKSMNAVILAGPTTLDGVKIPNVASSGNKYLATAGHKLVVNNLPAKTAYDGERVIYVGHIDDTYSPIRENVIINNYGGAYGTTNSIYFGSLNNKNNTASGLDLTVNGGAIYNYNFLKGTTYSGNVNIVLNKFSTRGDTGTRFYNDGSTFNGAFHFVINNGMFSNFISTAVTNMNAVTAKGGAWIIRGEKATDGSTLVTTDDAGKFIVDGNMVANAYKVTDGVTSETVSKISTNGILDLSDSAGIYVVKYTTREAEANHDSKVYVDAENGKDLNAGTSIDSAFATFEFAANWLALSDATEKEIVIIGNSQYSMGNHNYDVTISGLGENATLKMNGSVNAGTTFNNITLDGLAMATNGKEIVFNKVDFTKYTDGKIVVGPSSTDNPGDVHKATFNGLGRNGRFAIARIGKPGGVTNGDIEIVVNDGYFWQFSCEGTNTYNGNINFTLNGGMVWNESTPSTKFFFHGAENSTFNGAVQFIVNSDAYNSYEKFVSESYKNLTAKGGKWLVYTKAFDDAHSAKLSTTDVAGTYNVTGAKYAKAVDRNDATKVYYSKDGIITLPAGTYDVSYFNVLKQGDANNDDNLDIRDLVAIKQAIADSKPLELTIDLNFDNLNNAEDVTILAKHFLCVEKIVWTDTLNYLSNTYTKLVNDKKLNVAFIGGSVTEAVTDNGGWPTLVCNWLGEKYNADITEIRAGRSGTNSYFGAHRFDTEIGIYNPDLFFIEFAFNDWGPLTYDEVTRTAETLIHKAYAVNPNCDIVFVLIFGKENNTMNYEQLRAHRDIAEKYGLKTIKIADKFYEYLNETGTKYEDYIKDYVHPNNEGNALYAEIITEQLGRDLPYSSYETNELIDHTESLPESVTEPMMDAKLLLAENIDFSKSNGWNNVSGAYSWFGTQYGNLIGSSTPGSVLEFTFEGKGIGLLYNRNSNIGMVSISVDGGEPVVIDGYTSSTTPGHKQITPILEDLDYGTHTVTITLLSEKNEKSSGNLFTIPAFLIH